MNGPPTVLVVGGGMAGLSAACALAEAGLRVELVERRSYLGGRASSFLHPGVGEVIDNCQHVLFGCCTNLIGFYRRIGALDRIRWSRDLVLIEPGGRRSVLGPSPLPPPLHAAPRFLAAGALGAADKLAIARALGALAGRRAAEGESLGSWLRRRGQTERALRRFWSPVIASALNADLDFVDVSYGSMVVRELFLNSAAAGRLGVSTVPLGDLHARAREHLERRGGSVHFNRRVEEASWDEKTSRWRAAGAAGALEAEHLVLALPFEAMAKLLPRLPAAPGAARLAEQLARHESWPICSVHLWFDREVAALDHAALLDRQIHWMYNKGRIQPGRNTAGSYLELVVSASRSFAALSAEEAVARARGELEEFFPEVRGAALQKSAFVKEVRATFGVSPGIDAARPGSESPWPNCCLAGDWTATGWPSTMESAVRSGHLAAEAVCRRLGRPRRVLEPDLPPRGLMRWAG